MYGRIAFVVHVLQVLLLINSIALVLCQTGFLSIDCGSDVDYVDSTTGITWETDDKYISTGKNAQGITFPTSYVNVLNRRQVETLRYFDEGRGRDCYVLPVKPQNTYLVRPTFFHGNWQKAGPSNFDVYLNATFWLSIAGDSGAAQDNSTAHEALVYSTGTQLNLCLVKLNGTAFISSLELRELARGMYQTVVATNTFLSLSDRSNPGALVPGSYVRYPEDLYDRVWYAGAYPYEGASIMTKTSISSSNTFASNRPPPKVMEDAWIFDGVNGSIFYYYKSFRNLVGDFKWQLYGYFQDLEDTISASNVRGMEYLFNGDFITQFNTSDQPVQQASLLAITDKRFVNVTLTRTSWSKLNTIVNAFEIYYIHDFNVSATAHDEVNAVVRLQRGFNLSGWSGDPCVPVPYDWLNCTFTADTPSIARVTQLFLANESWRMSETIGPLDMTNLTALTYLNISYNRLTTFPTNLKELNLAVLDVSNNLLSGNIGNFLEALNLGALLEIHAADNQFEGEIGIDSLVQLKNLKIGNFDRNVNINGLLNLSEWHASLLTIVQGGDPVRQLFSLVDNNITDIYPKLDALAPAIEAVLVLERRTSMDNGILLGGNPYCKETKSTSLAQQYLCRFSTGANDTLFQTNSHNPSQKTLAIALGTSIGGFVLLVLCVCSRMLWRLRKQTDALLEIQEALAKQQVQPPFYSYTELRAATRDFSTNNKLGEGGFGIVYKAIGVDGAILAVKKLKLTKQVMTEFLNEMVLITGIKHRNLVQLKGCCIQEKERILVYEFAENGNLAEALWGQGTQLDWQRRFNICVGVARGLSYLHEEVQPRIIHRDIKSANILIDKDFNAKIGDFGLARLFFDDQSQAHFSQRVGTLGYFAPEYATQGQLTEKADVFSFGVLLLEIVSGRKCIDHKLPSDEMFLLDLTKKLAKKGKLLDLVEPVLRESSNNIDKDAKRVIDIAIACINVEPTRRPIMSQIVSMLQGSMDVAVFLDNPGYSSRQVSDFSSISSMLFSGEVPSFCFDSGNVSGYKYPLLNVDSNIGSSSKHYGDGGSIEISALSAR